MFVILSKALSFRLKWRNLAVLILREPLCFGANLKWLSGRKEISRGQASTSFISTCHRDEKKLLKRQAAQNNGAST
jgi:hypothetical protein